MASSSALKGAFVSTTLAQDGYTPSSVTKLSANAIMPLNKRKFTKLFVAAKDNATNEHGDLMRVNGSVKPDLKYSGEKPKTPILDTINYPKHMKNLSVEELETLADELREEIVYTVSKTGGHLSSSLGVIELTVSLHHVFNTPDDKIIWDDKQFFIPHKVLYI